MLLSGWGNYPRLDAPLLRARGEGDMLAAINANASLIARGMGRSYGDSSLNRSAVLSLLPSDRILSFDPLTGLLQCEAGLVLADLIALFLPRGWFVPVTPGTKFVTIGGMIASDVHGKNHHGAGSFGDHVAHLVLALADGTVVRCSPAENAELFAATRGGMGLTGVIVSAAFFLQKIETALIRQTTFRAANLDEACHLFESHLDATYAVAWIDALAKGDRLGRSLLHFGEHAKRDEIADGANPLAILPRPTRSIPCNLPSFALNRLSVTAFNHFYYRAGREGEALVDLDAYFYPLDALQNWNRLYGRRGFVQYQCVLPKQASAIGLKTLLARIADAGCPSFLAVLKLLGDNRGEGLLSFPMQGYTLALDFPATPATFALLNELDAIVADYGGHLYLAKDARMGAEMLRRGYPRLDEFLALRDRIDPLHKFSSLQAERLGLSS